MDFVEYCSKNRSIIDREINNLFSKAGYCGELDIPESLCEVMSYALSTGGKRLRPVLTLTACEAMCGEGERALGAALAIEVLHTYTLVHDDMPCMDNDMYRRGMLSVHAKFGYSQAVLAGDAMQALAFYLASKTKLADASKVNNILTELSLAAGPGGVVGGQWVDVLSTPPHSLDRINYVHTHKTSDLIKCATVMGAIAGGAEKPIVELFRKYAHGLGFAFQIIDDLLDADDVAKKDEIGILRVMSKEDAIELAKKYTNEAIASLDEISKSGVVVNNSALDILRSLAEQQLSRKI